MTTRSLPTLLFRVLAGTSLLTAAVPSFTQIEIPNATKRVKQENGLIKVLPRYSTEGVNNRWPSDYEEAFLKRVGTMQ